MKQILIVEDDSWQADHFARQLERAGYGVSVAGYATEAVDSIDRLPPDAIVLDMFLPGVNGAALLHEIRSHADLAHIPVIVCSTTQLELATLRPYGVVAVLDKAAMTNSELVAAIRKATA